MNIKSSTFESLIEKKFRTFILARFLLNFSIHIQIIIVSWQVYQLTNDALSLGMIGLAEAIPAISISLFGGHFADKYNRKKIIYICISTLLFCSVSLFFISKQLSINIVYIYTIIFVSGLARGVLGPTLFSFWPQLLPTNSLIKNATLWNSIIWQFAITIGPIIGGLMIAPLGISLCYLVDSSLVFLSFILFAIIPYSHSTSNLQNVSIWQNIKSGITFVFKREIILAAITLDLFAVLFGGATAILPVFTTEILKIGASEYGILKSASGIGSIVIISILTFYPLSKKAGLILLISVFCFGLSTVGFALSTTFQLAFIMLFLCGLFDGISVIVRSTLIQIYTPQDMKGRVSAVNNIFIGSSNEIGAFESGFAAKTMGLIPSIIFGGAMSMLVVVIIGFKFKKLLNLNLSQ